MADVTDTTGWVQFLEGYVGEVEHPAGSNCCRVCDEYGNLGVNCYAWCCALQDLACEHVFGKRLLHTAAVGQAKANAIAGLNGLSWIPRSEVASGATPIRVGDVVCYDYGGRGNWNDFHTEGVVNPYTQVRFQTIGGNRQNRCDYWWNSLNNAVMGFIRLPFETVGLGPITHEEDELAKYEDLLLSMQQQLNAQGEQLTAVATELTRQAPIVRGDGDEATPDNLHDLVVSLDTQIKEVRRNVRVGVKRLGVEPEYDKGSVVDISKVQPIDFT